MKHLIHLSLLASLSGAAFASGSQTAAQAVEPAATDFAPFIAAHRMALAGGLPSLRLAASRAEPPAAAGQACPAPGDDANAVAVGSVLAHRARVPARAAPVPPAREIR